MSLGGVRINVQHGDWGARVQPIIITDSMATDQMTSFRLALLNQPPKENYSALSRPQVLRWARGLRQGLLFTAT